MKKRKKEGPKKKNDKISDKITFDFEIPKATKRNLVIKYKIKSQK
jgi:hypothetical protein